MAAFKIPIGKTGGSSAGIPGNGGFGRGRIMAGGPTTTFSGWLFHSESGQASFAPDGSKLSRIPASVEITIEANSSKDDLSN